MIPEEEVVNRIPSGLEQLDKSLGGGFQNGYLYVLGARPAMGKTALALGVVWNAIEKGMKVTYYSLSMTGEKLIDRLLFMKAQVSFYRKSNKLSEDEMVRYIDASTTIRQSGLIVDDTPNLSIEEMSRDKMHLTEYRDSQLIIIDYVQLIRSNVYKGEHDFESRRQEVNCISGELQRTIGTMADVVLFLYRDEYYNFNSERKGIAEITIAKNELGCRSHSECVYLPEYNSFANKMRD